MLYLIRASAVVSSNSTLTTSSFCTYCQGLNFLVEHFFICNTAIKTPMYPYAQFDLGHIQPAAMFWRKAEIKPLSHPSGLLRLKSFVSFYFLQIRGWRIWKIGSNTIIPRFHSLISRPNSQRAMLRMLSGPRFLSWYWSCLRALHYGQFEQFTCTWHRKSPVFRHPHRI